jgi:hypothetical protein
MMDESMKSIEDSIKHQMDRNRSKNLLFANAAQIMTIDSSFLAALEEFVNHGMPEETAGGYSELIAFTVQEFIKRLHSINPYLRIDEKQIAALRQIYGKTWQRMRSTKNVTATLDEFHYPELSKWLAILYPDALQEGLRGSPDVGKVTYGEYSADLQLELLGIDTATIKQPILDIGCGSQANLVGHLRSLGLEAYGIDRRLETPTPYLH